MSSGVSLAQGLARFIDLQGIQKNETLELHEGSFTTRENLKKYKVKPSDDIKQYLHNLECEIAATGAKPAISLKNRNSVTVEDTLTVLSQYEQVTCKSAPEPIYAKPDKTRRFESQIESHFSDVDSLDDETPPPLPEQHFTADEVWEMTGHYFDERWKPTNQQGWQELINLVDTVELKKLAFVKMSSKKGFKDTDPPRVMAVNAYARKRIAEIIESDGIDGAVKHINTKNQYEPNKLLGIEARSAFSKIVKAKDVVYLSEKDNWSDIIKLMSSAEVKKLAYTEMTKEKGFPDKHPSRLDAIKVYAEKRLNEVLSEGGISGAEDFLKKPGNISNYSENTTLGKTFRELLAVRQELYTEVTYKGSKLVNSLNVLGLNYEKKTYTREQLNEAYLDKLRMLEEKNDVKSEQKRQAYSNAFEYLSENPPEWWGWDASLEGEKVNSYDPADLETLGLDSNSTPSLGELKKAYHEAAKKHHPDKGGTKLQFQKVDEAYHRLRKYFS
ncbi:J domain-containing protein [Endozoicomonas sp. ONNA2]|uniref:J domain-containing protein n=1 Tax=Endozoicomonas sp. ONNA2 TaxID=2828741 RepID=UPI002147CF39|nr:J domain-containing protein [Endozoicomonas sp. ONNA2]